MYCTVVQVSANHSIHVTSEMTSWEATFSTTPPPIHYTYFISTVTWDNQQKRELSQQIGHLILAATCMRDACVSGCDWGTLTALHNKSFKVGQRHKGTDRQEKSWRSWSLTQKRLGEGAKQIKWSQRSEEAPARLLQEPPPHIRNNVGPPARAGQQQRPPRGPPSCPACSFQPSLTISWGCKVTASLLKMTYAKKVRAQRPVCNFDKMAKKENKNLNK